MQESKYEELLDDRKVFKIYTIGGGIFRDSNATIAIQFFFMHAGDIQYHKLSPEKRVFIKTFPLENLIKEIRAYSIEDSILILANADNKDYALTYRLTVDSQNKVLKLKIEDWPTVGDTFITNEESQGLELNY